LFQRMRVEHLRQRLGVLGAKPCHARRVLQGWVRAIPLDTRRRRAEDFLPLSLRQALPELQALVSLRAEQVGADGSARWLLALGDGQTVESVLLPRGGVCVSTQVGCAVGCRFCMTGRDGLLRQLGSAEIVAQVALAQTRQKVRRVVFMGMGEPAHNLDNVLEAIELLGTEGQIGHKDLVFSTVGDRRALARLPKGPVRPALALSLHSTRAGLRAELLPKAPRIEPAELVALAEDYAQATGYPIQYQWTLLEGVNDTEEELRGIVKLLAGKYAVMNFIPYNANEGMGFRRPSWEHAMRMAGQLHQHGIVTRLRNSAGQDVEGGCGQLRARTLAPEAEAVA
jgi:23S rRNA (adenine2503-C2)-methyltransferase